MAAGYPAIAGNIYAVAKKITEEAKALLPNPLTHDGTARNLVCERVARRFTDAIQEFLDAPRPTRVIPALIAVGIDGIPCNTTLWLHFLEAQIQPFQLWLAIPAEELGIMNLSWEDMSFRTGHYYWLFLDSTSLLAELRGWTPPFSKTSVEKKLSAICCKQKDKDLQQEQIIATGKPSGRVGSIIPGRNRVYCY